MRDGGEVGGVGLDQQSVERDALRDLLQGDGVLEGHDPRERDVEAEVERGTRRLPVLGEAVHDAADGSGAFFTEQAQGVLPGFAQMHDQRLAAGTRGGDVPAETRALPFRAVLVPVVVEARLADGDDLGMRGQAHQFVDIRIGALVVFGMDTDAGEDLCMGLGEREDLRQVFDIDADAERAADVLRTHLGEDLRQIVDEGGEIEVAVGIDEHGVGLGSSGSRNCARGSRQPREKIAA